MLLMIDNYHDPLMATKNPRVSQRAGVRNVTALVRFNPD